MKRNLFGILHESKKPPPHIHVVGHYKKVFIARLGKRRGGGCIEIMCVMGREGARAPLRCWSSWEEWRRVY